MPRLSVQVEQVRCHYGNKGKREAVTAQSAALCNCLHQMNLWADALLRDARYIEMHTGKMTLA